MASHRKGLSQNLKQEENSSSIRACYCPLDTHLELTVNIKSTLLIISWRAVSETGTWGLILWVFLLKSAVVSELLADFSSHCCSWCDGNFGSITSQGAHLLMRWKSAATIATLQENFHLYHWLLCWLLQELHRSYFPCQKSTKGKITDRSAARESFHCSQNFQDTLFSAAKPVQVAHFGLSCFIVGSVFGGKAIELSPICTEILAKAKMPSRLLFQWKQIILSSLSLWAQVLHFSIEH